MRICRIGDCDSTDLATRSNICRRHHNEYTRAHYRSNKEQYTERNRKRLQAVRDVVNELKSAPCADCKNTFPPYAMDFDHLGLEEKLGNVSQMASLGLKKVLKEIEKCEVVCAVCHRIRTHKRNARAD